MNEFEAVVGEKPRKNRTRKTRIVGIAAAVLTVACLVMLPSFTEAPRDVQIAWLFTLLVVAGPVACAAMSLADDAGKKATPEHLEKIALEIQIHGDLRDAIKASGDASDILHVEALKALEIIKRRRAILKVNAALKLAEDRT